MDELWFTIQLLNWMHDAMWFKFVYYYHMWHKQFYKGLVRHKMPRSQLFQYSIKNIRDNLSCREIQLIYNKTSCHYRYVFIPSNETGRWGLGNEEDKFQMNAHKSMIELLSPPIYSFCCWRNYYLIERNRITFVRLNHYRD